MDQKVETWMPLSGIFLSNFQGGRISDFGPFLTNFGPFERIVAFQYAAGFRGPGILIKRSTLIVDLSA